MATSKKAASKKSSGNKASGKRVTTRRSRITEEFPTHFDIREGVPASIRGHYYPDSFIMMIADHIRDLKPNKKHFVAEKKYRNIIKTVAARQFPEIVLRTSINPDKETVSFWRTK
jgi:hypothetical protein